MFVVYPSLFILFCNLLVDLSHARKTAPLRGALSFFSYFFSFFLFFCSPYTLNLPPPFRFFNLSIRYALTVIKPSFSASCSILLNAALEKRLGTLHLNQIHQPLFSMQGILILEDACGMCCQKPLHIRRIVIFCMQYRS